MNNYTPLKKRQNLITFWSFRAFVITCMDFITVVSINKGDVGECSPADRSNSGINTRPGPTYYVTGHIVV